MMKEYAVYKGDELIIIGTAIECADRLNVKPDYIYWLTRPVAKKRLAKRKNPEKCLVAIKIDVEDDEQ